MAFDKEAWAALNTGLTDAALKHILFLVLQKLSWSL